MTLNGSAQIDDSTVSIHIEPPKKVRRKSFRRFVFYLDVFLLFVQVKFELAPETTNTNETHQDSIIRHLQDRMSDLREDNMRLRDHQKSRTLLFNNNTTATTTTSTSSNNTRSTFPEVKRTDFGHFSLKIVVVFFLERRSSFVYIVSFTNSSDNNNDITIFIEQISFAFASLVFCFVFSLNICVFFSFQW